jgi:hypothetical protein
MYSFFRKSANPEIKENNLNKEQKIFYNTLNEISKKKYLEGLSIQKKREGIIFKKNLGFGSLLKRIRGRDPLFSSEDYKNTRNVMLLEQYFKQKIQNNLSNNLKKKSIIELQKINAKNNNSSKIINAPEYIKIVSWNVEDFTVNIENTKTNKYFLNTLKEQDIILIQEWKEKKGIEFVNKLNQNNKNKKFVFSVADRTAVIYDSTIFNKSKTKGFGIKLFHQPPTLQETIYTSGRPKRNILLILFPYDENKIPICIINCHLSAFTQNGHKGFHKAQLNGLLQSSLEKIKELSEKKNTQFKSGEYGLIIGGDTNYRTKKNNNSNLLKVLIKKNFEVPCFIKNSNCNNGILKDICFNECMNQTTQSFKQIHEEGYAKAFAKFVASSQGTNKYKLNMLSDKRLDFLATNLNVQTNESHVHKLPETSDHSALLTVLDWKIDKTANNKMKEKNKRQN